MPPQAPHKKVLFICTGNTCRSPMAEGLMRSVLCGRKDVTVGSAGVAAIPGQAVSRETRSILKLKKAQLNGFKSRQVNEKLLEDATLIIAMTDAHAQRVKRFSPACAGRVKLLCDFIDEDEGLAGVDVPDPIGMGRAAYQEVAEVVELALAGIISELDSE